MNESGSTLVSSQKCNIPRSETNGIFSPYSPAPNPMRTNNIGSSILLRCALSFGSCHSVLGVSSSVNTIYEVRAPFWNRSTLILSFIPLACHVYHSPEVGDADTKFPSPKAVPV